ncbi:flagellar protein G [uncultured archaeon]|nr:flagellar protein G [uncultured archaeon]
MGSLATSELIFFIATLVISASVVGVLGGQTLHITQSISQSSKTVSSTIDSGFEIINDPSSIPYNSGYVFYIKNTGSESFYFTNNTISTVINGTLLSGSKVEYQDLGGNGMLMPGQVGTITANLTLSPGYYTLDVTLSNGLGHSMVFRVN